MVMSTIYVVNHAKIVYLLEQFRPVLKNFVVLFIS